MEEETLFSFVRGSFVNLTGSNGDGILLLFLLSKLRLVEFKYGS